MRTVISGQLVDIREVEDQIWLVRFQDYDPGYFDNERGRVESGPNSFAPDKVLTMCPEYPPLGWCRWTDGCAACGRLSFGLALRASELAPAALGSRLKCPTGTSFAFGENRSGGTIK